MEKIIPAEIGKPKISKLDLRLGNLFEQGIVFKISGRTGAKIHLHGRAKFQKGHLKIRDECFVTELIPVPLTPEVLVEWCGFEDMDAPSMFNHFTLHLLEIYTDRNGSFWYNPREGNSVPLRGLHELQNLYYVLNKKELEIRE